MLNPFSHTCMTSIVEQNLAITLDIDKDQYLKREYDSQTIEDKSHQICTRMLTLTFHYSGTLVDSHIDFDFCVSRTQYIMPLSNITRIRKYTIVVMCSVSVFKVYDFLNFHWKLRHF